MSEKIGKILAVDDNEDILFALKLLLKNHVELIQTETDPSVIPELLHETTYDVILLDMNFTQDAISGQEGFNWLEKILDIDPDAVVVFITAYGDAEKAVKAIKAGATDFILVLPWFENEVGGHQGRGHRLHSQTMAEREAAGHRLVGHQAAALQARGGG